MRALRHTSATCLLTASFALLITCTGAQSVTVIKNVALSVEPAVEVERGTNMTLTCTAEANHASGVKPAYKYSFFKDYKDREIAMMTPTDNVSHVTYSIPNARAFHSGTYKCKVTIDKESKMSDAQKIVVTGLQTPVLTVDKTAVREGEGVSVSCRAEGEVGQLTFTIKNGSKEIYQGARADGSMQTILTLQSVSTAHLTCTYSTIIGLGTLKMSNVSNVVSVVVQELDITPSVTVSPSTEVIEGDHVNITCSVNPHYQNLQSLSLTLIKGKILEFNSNNTYTKVVKATDSGVYECSAEMNGVRKGSTVNLTVKELFSQPKVTLTPSDVFEGQEFTVTCYSTDIASERIRREDVKYSVVRSGDNITLGQFNGVYKAVAGTKTNGNYMCRAQVNTIIKESTSVLFEAKVLASRPVISVVGQVVLNQPFQILCHSANGSHPINYTLRLNNVVQNHSVSTSLAQQALFTVIIKSEAEIHKFTCGAQNYAPKPPLTSAALSALVIVPVQESVLTVVPTPEDITEGNDVYLICSTWRATPPITYRWYRQDTGSPLHTNTAWSNSSSHTLTDVREVNSGTYYCEAQNHGNNGASSERVTFTVKMARWKKALIIGTCLLGVAFVVIFLLIRYWAKRARVSSGSKAGMWSQGPPGPAHCGDVDLEEPAEPNVEYAEVMPLKAVDPTLVPPKKGTDTVYSEVQTPSQGIW